jgi:hypothetical protein
MPAPHFVHKFTHCTPFVSLAASVFFLPKTEMATDRNAACHDMR